MRDELLASLEVARRQELLGDAHKPLRLPTLGGGRIHGARRGGAQAHRTGRGAGDLTGAREWIGELVGLRLVGVYSNFCCYTLVL